MYNTKKIADFLSGNPTAFHIVNAQADELAKAGYTELFECEKWSLKKGGRYFVRRNDSAIIAFELPKKDDASGFAVMASHSDYPVLKIKENPEMKAAGKYTGLNVEGYGGGLWYTWFDKPLSVAGRLVVEEKGKLKTVLVNVDRDLMIIPSLAIHMNREANRNFEVNVQRDLLPLLGIGEAKLMDIVAKEAGVKAESIKGFELSVYNRTAPSNFGAGGELFAAPHLDDAACAFCSLEGFLARKKAGSSIPVHVVFDNEEVGSSTKQGAASTFLRDVLVRINKALAGDDETMQQRIAKSFMLSADNAHAIHPNYPDKCDPVNHPVLGGGVVLKFSANQKYTTDAVSAAMCRSLAEKAGIALQDFFNRSDMPGGSTLGNISGDHVAMRTADIGMAQLAMHSNYECCAASDIEDMIKLAKALFES